MKKTVAWILCFVFLLCGAIPVATAEEAVSSSSLDDELVVHYDFEGETEAEALSDKAKAVISGEDLVFTTKDRTTSYVADGIAYVAPGEAPHFYHVFGSSAARDLQNGDAITVLTRFNLVNTEKIGTGGYQDVFSIRHFVRVYGVPSTGDTTKLYIKGGNYTGNPTAQELVSIPNQAGESINLALTMQFNEASGELTCMLYLSADGGRTYENKGTFTFAGANPLSSASQINLGYSNTSGGKIAYCFDDFRIYSKVLTPEELASVGADAPGAVFHGVQTAIAGPDAGTYAVRFVGSIDSLAYREVGFEITAQNGYRWEKSASCVYGSLVANDEAGLGGIRTYTAQELRGAGSYLYALSIQDIPVSENSSDFTVTFTVRPYHVALDGNGERVYGTTCTVVYTGGVWQSSSTVSPLAELAGKEEPGR